MSDTIRRIGVLTGGGDCPGLNAVIRAVAKTAMYDHNLEVWGIEDGFLGLIDNRMHPLTPVDVSNILTQGGTILGSCNKADPSNFSIREGDRIIKRDVHDWVLRHIEIRGLDALVVIGGDGTMAGAAGLIGRGVRVVGVPKTIDNDLAGTEVTFGFDTAVTTASDALDKVHTTASSHHRVMVVELMGRYAGWIALHAGVASGADIILIPELPFNLDIVANKCRQRSGYGKRFTIIAVAEGAKPLGGEMIVDHVDESSPDPIRLGGVGKFVADEVSKRTGLESRHIVLGHIQRGGSPSARDRVLATQFGHRALKLLMEGKSGHLVVQRAGKIDSVEIAEIAGKIRTVQPDELLVAAARGVGTCFGV
jgi:6-phosphofructokinase 1